MLTIEEVLDKCKIVESTLYRWIENGTFPQPVKVEGKCKWREEDIEAFLKKEAKAREALEKGEAEIKDLDRKLRAQLGLPLDANDKEVSAELRNAVHGFKERGKTYSKIAEAIEKKNIAILERKLGPDHLEVAIALNSLAGFYDAQGKLNEAEETYRRAIEILAKSTDSNYDHFDTVLGNFATLLSSQGKLANAEKIYRKLMSQCESTGGPDNPRLGYLLGGLASIYESQGKLAEAEDCFKRALAIAPPDLEMRRESSKPRFSVGAIPSYLNNLASLYIKQGRYSEAEPLCKKALAMVEVQLGPNNPLIAPVLHNLARIGEAQGQHVEAQQLENRARRLKEKMRSGPFGYFL
jgi:tetratricopeptide (TPR) repeat protein